MERVLILNDGYHDAICISDKDHDWKINSLLVTLAKPHREEYEIRVLLMEEIEERPEVPDEVQQFAEDFFSHGGLYRECSDYEFNSMYYFAEGVDI